jgi:hypothetical protein
MLGWACITVLLESWAEKYIEFEFTVLKLHVIFTRVMVELHTLQQNIIWIAAQDYTWEDKSSQWPEKRENDIIHNTITM